MPEPTPAEQLANLERKLAVEAKRKEAAAKAAASEYAANDYQVASASNSSA